MSTGEVACVVVAGVLLGLAAAAGIAVFVASRTRRTNDPRTSRADTCARWLAARLTVSRASLSFVAAFRALGAERHESIYFALRSDEAQRARADWCEAVRELDSAQAVMIAHGFISPEHDAIAGSPPVGVDSLRRAIEGSEGDIAHMLQRLREADRTAVDFVRSTAEDRSSHSWLDCCRRAFDQAFAQVDSIINRWSRPD